MEFDDFMPKIVKEGWLRKRGERLPIIRQAEYFLLLENGKLMSFSSNPGASYWDVSPSQVFFTRASNCKNIFSRLSDMSTHGQSEIGNLCRLQLGIATKIRKLAFTVHLLKQNKIVKRTFYASSSAERDEWVESLTELRKHWNSKLKTIDDFNLLGQVGSGSFGQVMLCREKSTGHPYAMKLIRKARVSNIRSLKFATSEKHLLQTLDHPLLVHMKYSFQTEDRLCFVTEFLTGGNLSDFVSRSPYLSEDDTLFYASEIASAVGYLHERKILHRDLKLDNIMIDSAGHIRLVDFGLCKIFQSSIQRTKSCCGTLSHLAPEVLSKEFYGFSVDWWGFGVVLYEMLCGKTPFRRQRTRQEMLIAVKGELKFTRELSAEAMNLVQSLLQLDPASRLGCHGGDVREIQSHAFFQGINWNEVRTKQLKPPFVPELTSDVDMRYFKKFTKIDDVELFTSKSGDTALTKVDKCNFDKLSDYSYD